MKIQDIEGYTPITQKSIDNVKCTRIISGEGSDKYNKYIQYLAKKVLLISANRTDGHAHDEVGILARLDGTYESQPIYGYWNEKAGTSIIKTRQNIEYNFLLDNSETQSTIFVHNHPNNSIISINDAFELITTPEIKCIVAIGNNGNIHYVLKKSLDFEVICNKIWKLIYKNKITKIEAYNKLFKNPDKYDLHVE